MTDIKKRRALLELLSFSAEDDKVSTPEEEQRFYADKAGKIEQLIDGTTPLDGNFTFDELLEVSVKRKRKLNTVLPNIQKTAQYLVNDQSPAREGTSSFFSDKLEIKECLESVCRRAESMIPVLVATDSSLDDIPNIVTQQTAMLSETQELYLGMQRMLSSAQDANKKAEKANEKAEKATESTLSTVLTVLGIFVAIIIAVVAVYLNGVADIKSLSKGIASSISTEKLILFSSLRWHVTFLLIFFLIFLIAKLTGRSLAGMCKKAGKGNESCDCSVCEQNCGKAKQILKRFPWFVLMNMAFLAVEFLALFVEIHGWSNIKSWFGLKWSDVNWTGIFTTSAVSHWIMIMIMIILAVILCISMYKRKKSGKKKRKKD